jgi:NADPH:quinone reductase-like Zn-dependent oxidoreductase
MKAARLVAFGEPVFELQEVADPAPAAGEVVVSLRAAGLNRRDAWVWNTPGYCPLPVTLGSDGAGVVCDVGAGVTNVTVGDEVVINPTLGWEPGRESPGTSFDILGAPLDGTFAEKVLVAADSVAPRPQRLTWEESATMNLAGLTAWRAAVRCARVGPHRSVLVTGAGGGVSTFAVQIAVALGATVYVTSSSPEKIARALELGATAGFRYDDPEWPQQLQAAHDGGVDAVIDSFGGPSWAAGLGVLRRGGVLVSFGDTGAAEATVSVSDVYWQWRSIVGTTMGSPEEYRAMVRHVTDASWRPVIDATFPLERIGDAAHHLEHSGERFGKVALTIGGPD